MTLKVSQGHQKWRYSTDHISLVCSICSNNVSSLDHFPHCITFTVYSVLDLKQGFIFDMAVEITGYIRFPICVQIYLR